MFRSLKKTNIHKHPPIDLKRLRLSFNQKFGREGQRVQKLKISFREIMNLNDVICLKNMCLSMNRILPDIE